MQGKTAVVTGSTQGLGESICRKLISDGLQNLLICGRNEKKGLRLESEFNSLGCKTIFVRADFRHLEDIFNIINTVKSKFSKSDFLVNSAGITERGTLLDTTPKLFDDIFNINVRAPFFLMQGISKLMLENKIEGSIINIISMSSYGGQPFLSAYSSSKAALATLTKNSAFALMKNHIRVNGINLGWTDTPGEDYIQKKYHNAKGDWLIKAEKGQPLKRLIKPNEVAELVYFILSKKSGILTGSLIDYDQSVEGAYYKPAYP